MLFQTSPPIVENNGPVMICQSPTTFANEQVGNTVQQHWLRPGEAYWQANEYSLDGTIGYGTTTVEAVKTVANAGVGFFNWHEKSPTQNAVNGDSYTLLVDVSTFTRVDGANTYNGEPYAWPPEFMIHFTGRDEPTGGDTVGPVAASDTRYFQMDGSCYRPVYSGDGYFSAPFYTVTQGVSIFTINDIGLTADGNTFVLLFTIGNIDPAWQDYALWPYFGPVFEGSCRYGLIKTA